MQTFEQLTSSQQQQLQQLCVDVYHANMALVEHNLVTFTWGNVSAIDRETGLVVIKPSGIDYEKLTPDNMVVVDLNGNIWGENSLNPSSDTKTHLALYRAYDAIGGIVHTHSDCATSWAQAGLAIPALGTTHADYFYGDIPCTRALTNQEMEHEYELNTGKVIIETLAQQDDVMAIPAIIVKEHAPFAWGHSADNAVHNAVVVEKVAQMAYQTRLINPNVARLNPGLLDKHYLRKHGKEAYYGQKK